MVSAKAPSAAALTPSISAALCGLLEERLGVSADRIYISFDDVPARLWGWNGSTFG